MGKKKTSSPPVIVEWFINTGFANARHKGRWEIEREEWDSMDVEEREKYLGELMDCELTHYVDSGWNVLEGS